MILKAELAKASIADQPTLSFFSQFPNSTAQYRSTLLSTSLRSDRRIRPRPALPLLRKRPARLALPNLRRKRARVRRAVRRVCKEREQVAGGVELWEREDEGGDYVE